MDVWEVQVASCPALDRGPILDVGPTQVEHLGVRAPVEQADETKIAFPAPVAAVRRGFTLPLRRLTARLDACVDSYRFVSGIVTCKGKPRAVACAACFAASFLRLTSFVFPEAFEGCSRLLC
jgi:hypothetical protein